ncbi:MAG: alpha/beta fold hydrolase [Solirubrobacteraceae bacterium]
MRPAPAHHDRYAFTDILGLRTRFLSVGDDPSVLVLHGWGGSIESVTPIVNGLDGVAGVVAVDLPGFGQTALPPQPWGVADYADWVLALIEQLGLDTVAIVGHSNGGRIAIKLAAEHPERITRLLLVDSAGIRPHRTVKYHAKVLSAKTVKHLAPRLGPLGAAMQRQIASRVASSDYASAGELRPTFTRLVNEDLTPLLSQIKAPTLLIWGERDDATPLADGQLMEKLIDDAALIVLHGAGHYSYLDDPRRFTAIARSFLATPRPTGPEPGTA